MIAGVAATIPEEDLDAVRNLDYVTAVHHDRILRASATPARNITQICADQVWSQLGTRGSGVTVAVIDTCIDYTHPALGGGFGPGKKVAGGYDFINGDADPRDDHDRGTHVAGIIAADGADLIGVAPDVTLIAYKVLGSTGQGTMSAIIAALERSADPNDDGSSSEATAVSWRKHGETTWHAAGRRSHGGRSS